MNGYLTNSTLTEFHILAFSYSNTVEMLFFITVLLIYLVATIGNTIIIALVCLESHLQTPMYFFLSNLSFLDNVMVSTNLPKLIAITLTGDNSISFKGCIVQMFLFTFCVSAELFLLSSMAYDRYVAICVPLRYSLIMNKMVCSLFVIVSWLIGICNTFLYCLLLVNLPFCNREINHFYCDLKTMLKLQCGDMTYIQNIISIEGVFIGLPPLLLILISYIYIIAAILKVCSSTGRAKAFSSCSSHMTTVILSYGTSISIYMIPESEHSEEQEKLLSLLYAAVVPMLNPLVYSLRNKEVLTAMKKLFKVKK